MRAGGTLGTQGQQQHQGKLWEQAEWEWEQMEDQRQEEWEQMENWGRLVEWELWNP